MTHQPASRLGLVASGGHTILSRYVIPYTEGCLTRGRGPETSARGKKSLDPESRRTVIGKERISKKVRPKNEECGEVPLGA